MQIMRIGAFGQERPVVLDEAGTAHDLTPLTDDVDGAFLAADGLARARTELDGGNLPRIDIGGQRIGAPVARPMAVVCIGQNYAAHAAESGSAPPEHPIVFLKHPNTVVGPNDEVLIPRGSARTDWEVELTVVIGKQARYLDSPDDAAGYVAGYTIGNDVSEREFQKDLSGGQWSKGKCAATFSPVGPWLLPAAELPDPQALGLRSWVNGAPRQNSSTRDMIFGVYELVHHLSQFMVLEPGDLVHTGTPEGVAMSGRFPYLKPGDVLELEIDSLGRQRQEIGEA